MNIITYIMRQHRQIHRLRRILERAPELDEATMATLGQAFSIHVSTTEDLLMTLQDGGVKRDWRAHAVHHERARLSLFQLATCSAADVARDRLLVASVLREHALHEARVLGSLCRAFDEGGLEALGTRMPEVRSSAAAPG